MDNPQCRCGVMVGGRIDERDVVIVPVDRHWLIEWRLVPRHHRETVLQAYGSAGADGMLEQVGQQACAANDPREAW
jgi:hypothetical protein